MEGPTAAGPPEGSNQTTHPTNEMRSATASETVPALPRKPIAEAGEAKGKPSLPPPCTVITVDTTKGDQDGDQSEQHQSSSFSAEAEGRTPKHANKASSSEERTEPERGEGEPQQHGFFPPRPFEGRMGGGPTGAFQPHTRSHGQLQSSPNSTRYYANFPSGPYQQNGPYERNMPEYQHRMPPYGSSQQPHPGMFHPPHPQFQQQGGYSNQPHPWGAPPFGRPPPFPPQHGMVVGQYSSQSQQGQPAPQDRSRGNEAMASNSGTFSRAVSSSFDRSVKSRNADEKTSGAHAREQDTTQAQYAHPMNGDGSVSDHSWNQLNQIQSVDEEEIRKRIADKAEEATPAAERKRTDAKPSNSNSSSLTNSPTDGVDKKTILPGPPKLTSSLDSLASVSSAQAPLKTPQDEKLMSPVDNSLDLMKCSSGSSALLLPPSNHGNTTAASAHEANSENTKGKRGHAESETAEGQKSDPEKRPAKKSRNGTADGKKSPLSIACSPSVDHHDDSKEKAQPDHQLYDKPLSYSYSLESVNGPRNDFPPVMTRPQSSASSTGTPMQVVPGGAERNNPSRQGVAQLPSWEIGGAESFGGHSAGNALTSNFSFSHDYPMSAPSRGENNSPQPQNPRFADRPIESRNQSFEGGHYHGSFSRAETMSFESRGQSSVPEQRQGYQGHFPPHAPSWGSAGSYPHPSGYPIQPPPQYRMTMQPMIMRSFSQDSEQHRMGTFQPPSEFQAPPTNINRNRPRKETHILTTPFEPSKSGVFGWTKEEDMRLTEIMKKYKNPRDWEPIAKELDRNRSAKECHERWIRYLKPGVRKGQWTDQEDEIVMEAVTSSKEQPFTRWSDLAQRLPGRVGKQIRDRWVNHLNPNINHLPFSKEDDLLLWEGHQKVGKRWVEIATKFFKGSRSENHIKNRWYSASFKKFIKNEFGPHAYSSKGGGSPKKESKKRQGKRGDTEDDPTFAV